jgi:diadenosine tetraphosphatase ApaH/serine/threonine PP2A family protein phosphatase
LVECAGLAVSRPQVTGQPFDVVRGSHRLVGGEVGDQQVGGPVAGGLHHDSTAIDRSLQPGAGPLGIDREGQAAETGGELAGGPAPGPVEHLADHHPGDVLGEMAGLGDEHPRPPEIDDTIGQRPGHLRKAMVEFVGEGHVARRRPPGEPEGGPNLGLGRLPGPLLLDDRELVPVGVGDRRHGAQALGLVVGGEPLMGPQDHHPIVTRQPRDVYRREDRRQHRPRLPRIEAGRDDLGFGRW